MVDFKKSRTQNKQFPASQGIEIQPRAKKKIKPVEIRISTRERWTRVILIACIMAYTALLFSNAIHNNFLDWDDNAYIRDNTDIKAMDGAHIKAMFSNYYVANWQPLTVLTYAIEYSFVGLTSPTLYHVDNIVLHLINVLLLFWLALLMFRNKWIAGLAALLFAVNPMRVESVSWIAERKDVLYACFFLLSMIMYHFYLRRGLKISEDGERQGLIDKGRAVIYYLLMIFSFMLSGMSKSASVVLPLVLLLIDFLYKRKVSTLLVIEKIPLLLISIVLGILALKSQSVAIKDLPAYSLASRLLIMNHSVLRYLFMTFVPVNLSALHPYPTLVKGSLPVIYYISPFLSLALAASVYFSYRYTRKVVFAILFFLINLVLVLQVIQVGDCVIAERYTYMPHTFVFIIVAYYLYKLWEKEGRYRVAIRSSLGILLVCLLSFYSIATYSRNPVWEGPVSLWTDVLKTYPESAFSAYYNRGKARQDLKQNDEALQDYNMAIQIRQDHYKAYTNRGLIKQGKGDIDGAMSDYNNALRIMPKDHITFINRGSLKMIKKDYTGAEEDFAKAIELNKNQIESWYNRGMARYQRKNFSGTIEDLNVVLQMRESYQSSFNYRGSSKFLTGDKNGACKDWQTGLQTGDEICKQNLEKFCK